MGWWNRVGAALLVVGVAAVALSAPPAGDARRTASTPTACIELSDELLAGQVLLGLVDRPSGAAAMVREGALAGVAPFGSVSAAVVPPVDELRPVDLVPFQALIDGGGPLGVMVGHLEVPGLTDGVPASLSGAAVDGLLRGELGFDGVVVSDALGMGAIAQRYTAGDAAVRFLSAGGDLAVVSVADVAAARSAIVAALRDGVLDRARLPASVARVMAAKHLDPCTLRPVAPTSTTSSSTSSMSTSSSTSMSTSTTATPTTTMPTSVPGSSAPPPGSAPDTAPAAESGRTAVVVVAAIVAVGVGVLATLLLVRRRRGS